MADKIESADTAWIKYALAALVTLLVAGAIYLIVARGPAIIIDMAASAAAFICM